MYQTTVKPRKVNIYSSEASNMNEQVGGLLEERRIAAENFRSRRGTLRQYLLRRQINSRCKPCKTSCPGTGRAIFHSNKSANQRHNSKSQLLRYVRVRRQRQIAKLPSESSCQLDSRYFGDPSKKECSSPPLQPSRSSDFDGRRCTAGEG